MVKAAVCSLCGLSTAAPLYDDTGRPYCCPACREVAQLLAEGPSVSPAPAQAPKAHAQEVTLALGEMWCPSCSWFIEERLKRTPGVFKAQVNFLRREARVVYDPERIQPRALAKRVRRWGYRAWTPDETPEDEEEVLFTRILISLVFVMHIMIGSFILYARQLLGLDTPDTLWMSRFFYLTFFLASLPLLYLLGWPILRTGLVSLGRRQPNMHTLIALGAFSAFALSTRNLFLGQGHVYFDTAAMLLFLVTIGHWLEVKARSEGIRAMEKLWKRLPREALWISPEGPRRVPVDELPPGARVRVEPGEPFPVDGIVAQGEGEVDESLLTGEAMPVYRRSGDRVYAGTVSVDGAFEVITVAVGAETVAGQIGRMLHQALWQRSPVERLADRIAAVLVPVAVLVAAGTFVYWTRQAGLETGLMNALSVLLITCPCALGLATPLTLWVGLQRASGEGALVRNTAVLERLARVRVVFLDKTGTLTQQPLRVSAVWTSADLTEDRVLAWVAALEAPAKHPIAEAFLRAAKERGLSVPQVHTFTAHPGQGVEGTLNGRVLYVGNERLLQRTGLRLSPDMHARAERWRQEGRRVIYVGWEGEVRALVALEEALRPEVPAVLNELRALGCRVEVLTGDHPQSGARWEERLGVSVRAGLSPEEKLSRIRETEEPAAVVGDGINDGPALAAADVGIAMGRGTDIAHAAAEVILLRDDLRLVPWLLRLARAVRRKVHQNLAWAFVYNLIGVGLAVMGYLQPILAALAMVASSLLVTTNALRLRTFAGPSSASRRP